MISFGWAVLALVLALISVILGSVFFYRSLKKTVAVQERFTNGEADQMAFVASGLRTFGVLILFGAITVALLIAFVAFVIAGVAAL